MENGVRWRTWSKEAFEEGRKSGKDLIAIICTVSNPWCRKFFTELKADKHCSNHLNEKVIPVLVDADDRPDINSRYNAGGLPTITLFSNEGDLLLSLTYISTEQLANMITQFVDAMTKNRKEIVATARDKETKIRQLILNSIVGSCNPGIEVFRRSLKGVILTSDSINGGFGSDAKYPLPASLEILLASHWEIGAEDSLFIIAKTFNAMAQGQLNDEGRGLFKFCESPTWTFPSGEKPAADNAEVLRVASESASGISEKFFPAFGKQIFEFLTTSLYDSGRKLFYNSEYGDYDAFKSKLANASRDKRFFSKTNFVVAKAIMAYVSRLPDAQAISFGWQAHLNASIAAFIEGDRVKHSEADSPLSYFSDHVAACDALNEAYALTGKSEYADLAHSVGKAAVTRYYDNELQGFADADHRGAIENGGKFAFKSMEDNALHCINMAKSHFYKEDLKFYELSASVLAGFPDLGFKYGHDSVQYALAIRFIHDKVFRVRLPASCGGELRAAVFRRYSPYKMIRYESDLADAVIEVGSSEIYRGKDPAVLTKAISEFPA